MEIHKPKPVRDWREFLSEMSVIVLGRGHGTWDSAVASQTVAHFPARRLQNFAVARQPLSSYEICKPMGKDISPTYGQAPEL